MPLEEAMPILKGKKCNNNNKKKKKNPWLLCVSCQRYCKMFRLYLWGENKGDHWKNTGATGGGKWTADQHWLVSWGAYRYRGSGNIHICCGGFLMGHGESRGNDKKSPCTASTPKNDQRWLENLQRGVNVPHLWQIVGTRTFDRLKRSFTPKNGLWVWTKPRWGIQKSAGTGPTNQTKDERWN